MPKQVFRYTTETFIAKCIELHGNKYSYENVEYINCHKKVFITCKIHGDFSVRPSNFINQGLQCQECRRLDRCVPQEKFIEKAHKIHNKKFDYSLVNYIDNNTKIKIICPIHGVFEQTPGNHVDGKKDCLECSFITTGLKKRSNTESFIQRANIVHNNFYDYNKVVYTTNKSKIIITCFKHGDFNQVAGEHLFSGSGCPKCNRSKGEFAISKYLDINNINYIEQKWFSECRNIYPLPFDFYIESYNLLIEYQGKQHFVYNPLWPTYTLQERQRLDAIKKSYALSNGYNFLEITYKQNIKEELNKYFNLIPI